MMLLSEIPPPLQGDTERWLWVAAALLSLYVLARKAFVREPPVDVDLKKMEKEIDLKLQNVRREMLEMANINTQAHAKIYERIDSVEKGARDEVKRLQFEIKDDFHKAGQQAEHRAEGIHQRINDVLSAVCRLEGKRE